MEQILFKFLFDGLLYVTIILLAYALFWGFTRHLLQRFGKYYHVAIGIVLASLSLFMTILFKLRLFSGTDQGNEFLYLFQVLYFWVAIVFISNIAGGIVGVTNLISMLYLSTLNDDLFPRMSATWFYILITVVYIAIVCLSTLRMFFTRLKPWMIWTAISTGCLLFIFIRFFSIFSDESSAIWEIALVSIWLMFSYVLYALIAVINRLHMSAMNLQNTITYENQYYVNNASANEVILKNVQSQNISYAIYFTFFIADVFTFEKSLDKKLNNEITKNITNQIYNLIVMKHQNAVFFKRDYHTFGIFIPLIEDKFSLSIDEEFEKQLKEIEESYNAVNLSFKYENLNIDLKLKNVVSFFGLHSNNLEMLDFYNKFHQEREVHLKTKEANIINIDTIQDAEIIRHQLNTILELVPLNTTEVTLNPIYNTTTKTYDMYLVDNIVDKVNFAYSGESEIEKRLNSKNLVSLLKRHLITISLERIGSKERAFKNSNLFLKYDHQVLANENIDLVTFKNTLKTKMTNTKNIYIGFDATSEIDDFDVIKNNVKLLKSLGIKTFIYNFGKLESDLSIISAYQPSYVFLNNDIARKCREVKNYNEYIAKLKIITDSVEAKIVATNINRYNEYKKLREINIELFTGKLFGQFENPTEISDSLLYLLNK